MEGPRAARGSRVELLLLLLLLLLSEPDQCLAAIASAEEESHSAELREVFGQHSA